MTPPITKKVELPSERIERERKQRFDFLKSPMGKTEITGALEKLKSQKPEERIAGAKKLGDLKALEGFEPLLNALTTEKDRNVKIAFLKSIREIGAENDIPISSKSMEQLKRFIHTEDYEVAREAVWAFAMAGEPNSVLDFFTVVLKEQSSRPLSDVRLYKEIADAYQRVDYR